MTRQAVSSLAIAGAWGYIGRKFLEAAQLLQLETSVFDPSVAPSDMDLRQVTQFAGESEFYEQQADVFHLALHPEHRLRAMETLLRRSHKEPVVVLCEKPMAAPWEPERCDMIVDAVRNSQAMFLYDFPELFDPITQRILDFLAGYDHVRIDSIVMQRSKDREDPAIARNRKRMVHIQYQESVHCLAFALYILAHTHRSLDGVLADGVTVTAEARPYAPPNPSCYGHVVDGQCEYHLTMGGADIRGRTDFKRGAPWTKWRAITGQVDGRQFSIEVDFLEGKKRLRIDGTTHDDVVHTNSYAEVIKTISNLRQRADPCRDQVGDLPAPGIRRA